MIATAEVRLTQRTRVRSETIVRSPRLARWSRRQRAQRTVLSMLAALLIFNVALSAASECSPWVRDPVYADRASKLRQHWRGEGRRLLVLGSSRTWFGFDALRAGGGCFNFGLPAAGPLTQQIYFERLLAEGLVPEEVVVEVMPALLAFSGAGPEELRFLNGDRLSRTEAQWNPRLQREWRSARLQPWTGVRQQLLGRVCAGALPWHLRHDAGRGVDGGGRVRPSIARVSDAERAAGFKRDRSHHAAALANFDPSPVALNALDALLNACARRGVRVTLLLMPEARGFELLYGPGVAEAYRALAATTAATHGCNLIDARGWIADDLFFDGHHLLDAGAASFTDRLVATLRSPQ